MRSRVHEYGGGAYAVRDGVVVFAEFTDGRLWRMDVAADAAVDPRPLTPAAPDAGLRHADPVIDPARRRIVCVQEDHRGGGEARNRIVEVALDPAEGQPMPEPRVLVAGHDFFSNPRVDPIGNRACWLAWDHPNMPWDGTELWVADVSLDGSFENARQVAGGAGESIFQPEWSPSGDLHFVSDRTDWWNLYRLDDLSAARPGIPAGRPLAPMDAEFGQPQWQFAMVTYAFVGPGQIVCRFTRDGTWRLAVLDSATGAVRPLDLGGTVYGSIAGGAKGRAVADGRLADMGDCDPPGRYGVGRIPRAQTCLRRRAGRAVRVASRARRVPHRGRADRARALLRPEEPGFRGAALANCRRSWSRSTAARPRWRARH